MPASWVGASVRARLLANRRLGAGGVAALAKSHDVAEALGYIAESPYGAGITMAMSAVQAQRHIAANLLWNLRLIAGWLPPGGAQIVQALAAWFEIANIEERLGYLAGGEHPSPYQLGRLGIAWPAVSAATSVDAVRAALAHSAWGDPRTSEPAVIVLALRFRWATWLATAVPQVATWSAAASTLLAARTLFTDPRPPLPYAARHVYGLPTGWQSATTLDELRAMLPRHTSWILDGARDTSDFWRAEARWWARVRRDAGEALVGSRFGPDVVVAAVALLAYDAWLTRAALAAVARGDAGRRVFDAVA